AISPDPVPIQDVGPSAAGVELPQQPRGSVSSLGDTASLFTRLLQGGPHDFLVSQIGTDIGDLGALRQALDDLDTTPGNVVLKTQGGVPRIDMTVARTFGGTTSIDTSTLGDLVALTGEATFSIDVTLHLVFGVDDGGFFIDPSAVAGPELTLSNLQLLGDISASGRVGFLQVDLTDGSLQVAPGVSLGIDLVDPGVDPITG